MDKKTALHATHIEMGARMVPFGGWSMPVNYGSQIEEHHAVRKDAGMFDVSHMLALDIKGKDAQAFLQYLLANDVAKLKDSGKALYSCMLNEQGGVMDDLIVYFLDSSYYRMVVNAGTAEKDMAWMATITKDFDVTITPRRDLAMIAVQGPNAREKALGVLPETAKAAADLGVFFGLADGDWFVARTGYTGEDGFEISLPESDAAAFWIALAEAGVAPCGLGCRDTLRLEAGMNLYGNDMDDDVSPVESGLSWTLALKDERAFVGRVPLEAQKAKTDNRRFVGLVLTGRGILRDHQAIFVGDQQVGEITSGGFSPSLEQSIALARVSADIGDTCEVEIRKKRVAAKVVKPTFVRHGKSCL